ncbi:hypothetical protein HOH45_08510 [bacterium]|jgi:hypothetical protein|nr:hypothetical protein [bacterium]
MQGPSNSSKSTPSPIPNAGFNGPGKQDILVKKVTDLKLFVKTAVKGNVEIKSPDIINPFLELLNLKAGSGSSGKHVFPACKIMATELLTTLKEMDTPTIKTVALKKKVLDALNYLNDEPGKWTSKNGKVTASFKGKIITSENRALYNFVDAQISSDKRTVRQAKEVNVKETKTQNAKIEAETMADLQARLDALK